MGQEGRKNKESRSFESYSDGAAEALVRFEGVLDKLRHDEVEMISVTIRLPKFDGDEYLLIARFTRDGERLVAFRSAEWLVELWVGFFRAIRHGNLKMKEDRYADGNS